MNAPKVIAKTAKKCRKCDFVGLNHKLGDSELFECLECDFKVCNKKEFNLHMRIHEDQEKYLRSKLLNAYRGRKNSVKKAKIPHFVFKCQSCNFESAEQSEIFQHLTSLKIHKESKEEKKKRRKSVNLKPQKLDFDEEYPKSEDKNGKWVVLIERLKIQHVSF